MHQRSIVRIGVPLAVAALALTACGSRGESGTTAAAAPAAPRRPPRSASSPRSPATCRPSARASSTPSSSPSSRPTTTNAVPAGSSRSRRSTTRPRPTSARTPPPSSRRTTQVIGVVGNLNSSVSQQTQPVFAAANITQISPANTDPTLTSGADAADPEAAVQDVLPHLHHGRRPGPVRRAVPPRRRASRTSRRSTTRRPTARASSTPSPRSSRRAAAPSSRPRRSTPTSRTTSAVVSKVAPSKPQAVYYGGEYPQAGPLSQQMKSAGLNVPLMGGDGIYDPKYIQLAGATANGDLATSVGAPTEQPDAGKKFLADYQAAGYAEPVCGLRRLLLRRRQRHHRGPQVLAEGARPTRSRARTRRRSTRSARSRSTASPARSRSTSSATPPARSSPSTRSTRGKWVAVKTDKFK